LLAGSPPLGRIVCESDSVEPCKSFKAPFHLGIDQQDRIWVSDSGFDHVTRFPRRRSDQGRDIQNWIRQQGLGINGEGNVWITNRFGSGLLGMAH